jgi:hypothetical protein
MSIGIRLSFEIFDTMRAALWQACPREDWGRRRRATVGATKPVLRVMRQKTGRCRFLTDPATDFADKLVESRVI